MGDEDGSVIRVVVVDDDEILLHGVHRWLAQNNDSSPEGTGDGLEVHVIATTRSVTEFLGDERPRPGARDDVAHRRNNGVVRPVDQARGGAAPGGDSRSRTPHPENPVAPPKPPGQRLDPVALLDLRLRDGRRVADNVRDLIEAGYAVVTCSTIDDAGLVHEAGRAGALSYVRKAKDAGDMRQALAAAARGERHVSQSHAALIQRARSYDVPELSGQEREALRLYASGLTMSSVARRLNVKHGTAKSYLDRVRDKYEQAGRAARTKLELRDRAVEDGVLN